MSSESTVKIQSILWWIASVAVSVLCCSVLFVFFASYIMDVKTAVADNNARIAFMEEREARIMDELDIIRRHVMPASVVAPVSAPAAAEPVAAPPPPAANDTTTPPVGTIAPAAPVETPVAPAPTSAIPEVVAPVPTPAQVPSPSSTSPSTSSAPSAK